MESLPRCAPSSALLRAHRRRPSTAICLRLPAGSPAAPRSCAQQDLVAVVDPINWKNTPTPTQPAVELVGTFVHLTATARCRSGRAPTSGRWSRTTRRATSASGWLDATLGPTAPDVAPCRRKPPAKRGDARYARQWCTRERIASLPRADEDPHRQ